MLISILSCKNVRAQDNFSEEQVKRMLNSFYTSYMAGHTNFKEHLFERLDSIERIYCTSNYFEECKKYKEMLEYNPLIKAQSSSIECSKTLTFKKDSIRNDLYYISYIFPYKKNQVTIRLTVIKENNDYKIDCVFLDDLNVECPCKKGLP